MTQKISWIQAVFLSTLSFIPSFFVFFLLEVIWGDVLKTSFSYENYQDVYFNLNMILLMGFLFVFTVSIFINLLIFKNYTYKSKLLSNIFTLLLTLILLFFACWILVVAYWPEFYASLSVLEKINLAAYFFIFVAIYLLPSPVWFWIISLIAYHIILVFFVKYLFTQKKIVRKASRSQLKKESKKNKNKAKTTKYKIL